MEQSVYVTLLEFTVTKAVLYCCAEEMESFLLISNFKYSRARTVRENLRFSGKSGRIRENQKISMIWKSLCFPNKILEFFSLNIFVALTNA